MKALDVSQNSYQWMSRVDYSISDNTKLFVRYNLQNELQQFPVGLWWRNAEQVPYPSNISAKNQSQSVSASLTNVLSPTLTNEFVAGYTYIDFPNTFDDPSKVSRAAVGYPYKGLYKNGLDQIPQVTSWASSVATMLNPSGFELGPGGNNLFAAKHLPSFSDNVSKVWGTHTMKFGMYYEKIINDQPSSNNSNDQLVFADWGSNSSGNGYADLLLGRAAQYSGNNYNILHNEGLNILEFFAQDSWKITRRLTLEYGCAIPASGSVVRPAGHRICGLRSHSLFERSQSSGHLHGPEVACAKSRGSELRLRNPGDVVVAAVRLCLRCVRYGQHGAARRLRHLPIPERPIHRSARSGSGRSQLLREFL